LQEDLLDDEESGIGGNLFLAECALREKGKHVHPDKDNHGIWVFSLSKPEEDDVSQFLNSVGFNYSSSGVLRSVDVEWASRQDGTVQKHETISNTPASMVKSSAEANTHTLRMHIKSESQAMYYGMDIAQDQNPNSGQDFTTTEIYPRIVAAILHSFSYSVADHGDLLRVGPYTFIESRTLGERLVGDLAWQWPTARTSTLSIQVKWLSSGTLIVAYTRRRIIRLYRASHFLPDNRRIGLSREVPLLLCPSGVTAGLHALEEIPKAHPLHRSGMQLKSSISTRLARIGYSVPQDSRWLRVLIEHDPSSRARQRITHRPSNVSVTIWPSQLCLCTDPVALDDGQLRDLVNDLTDHGPMDALAKAESWLLGKAARQKALENQRRKDDSELQKVNENRESDNENDLSDIELQANPYIASQDISGIYPTPPDGIPTNILDSSPNNNLPTSGIGNEEDAGSTPSALSRPYEERGNEDIYGEMDIDMFASNGLTEADFSFFDEPGMNDGTLEEEPSQIMIDADVEGGIITDPASATMSSEDNTVQLIQSNQVDSAAQNLSERDGERLEEQGTLTRPCVHPS
jgi:mediator of RNA polymerase II transcription subunit 13